MPAANGSLAARPLLAHSTMGEAAAKILSFWARYLENRKAKIDGRSGHPEAEIKEPSFKSSKPAIDAAEIGLLK